MADPDGFDNVGFEPCLEVDFIQLPSNACPNGIASIIAEQQRSKVRRHNTDAPRYPTKPVVNNPEVIIEDDYGLGHSEPTRQTRPSQKKPTGVARHHTEVLRKRTAVTTSQSQRQDTPNVLVTRRSLSRHGSRAQTTARLQVVIDEAEPESPVLKSNQPEEFIAKKTKLIRQSNKRLEYFKHSNETYHQHVHTRELDFAKKTVESKHVVVISGTKGSGKTHTALKLVETLTKTHHDTPPMIFSSSRDLSILMDLNSKAVILVDDFLGRFRFTDESISEWETVWNNVHYLIEQKRIFLILTSNQEYLMDLSKSEQSSFYDHVKEYDCLIALDRDKCKLSKDEKVKMLKTIGKRLHSSFKSSDMERLVSLEIENYGFPILCLLVSLGATADDLHASVDQFIEIYLKRQLNKTIPEYVALVLVLVFDGRLDISNYNSIEMLILDRVAALFDVDEDTINEKTLKVIAKHLEGRTLKKERTTYRITHDIFTESIATQILVNYDEHAIKVLPIDIVVGLQFEQSNDSERDTSNIFCNYVLRPKHYKLVAERFRESTLSDSSDILLTASSVLWEDATFSEIALTIIGVDSFFMPKGNELTLLAALCQYARSVTVEKVIQYITQYRQDIMKEHELDIQNALKIACKYQRANIVGILVGCCNSVDDGVMCAAAEGGNYDLLQVLIKQGGQIHDRKGDVIKTLCRHGHVDVVGKILDAKEGTSMLLQKGHKGNTLLHSAVQSTSTNFVEELICKGAQPEVLNRDGVSALHVAASYGRMATVRLLCDRYSGMLNLTDNNGFTAAHYAAREGHLDVLILLIDHGVPGNIKTTGSSTILHLAAYNGHTDILAYLLKKYPDLINTQNNESFTAPQIAARMGYIDTLQVCVSAGVSPDTKTVDGRTFLHLAAFNGHFNLVKYLCNTFPQLIEITDSDGNTIAHDAAASGNANVIDFILKRYISIKSVSHDGCSVLHDACYYGRQEVGMYLVDKCPELLRMKTVGGYTPCHGAALGGFVELYKFLVSKGADQLALSNDDSTVLHEASFSGKLDMVKHLCSTYPQLMPHRNTMDYTATHFAAQEGHLEVFTYLLSETKDPMIRTGESQTFLHVSSYNCRFEVVKYICENYPSMIMALDSTDATALHYAARGGSIAICNYLIERMVDPAIQTTSGSTILHLASYDGKEDLVKYLCQHYSHLLDIEDGTGHNAAHYAAGSDSIDVLKIILDSGVDPMTRTENGSTILLKAAYNGKLDMVKYILIQYPESIRITDNFGCNLAHYAVCAGNLQVLKYALLCSIDPMGQTSDGHTLLHIAAFHGQIHIVKYICEKYPEMLKIVDNRDMRPEHYAKEGQQEHVIQYLSSLRAHKSMSSSSGDDTDDDVDGDDARLCKKLKPCRECLVTCFRCGCTRECALNLTRGVWRRVVGLFCACRRN